MKIYNTLTRQKEEFKSIKENKVGIYSCGPTVYWNQHIGNMYAFLNWDILTRALKYMDYKVVWMMNITDVGHNTSDEDTGEDKMEKGAKREGLTPWEIAKKYEVQFLDSLDLLNIKRPDVIWRATDHIDEQIKLAQQIEKNGFTYKTKTGLVFDTSKFPDYAKFANLKLNEMESGARVEVDEDKKNPWDFLLWVTNQPNHIMKWNSPWGEGFPGWHLECTAMSTAKLGETFDIHTGGIEHIGVHHTNEIAQGFGAFGHNTAHYWMHNAWLTLKDGKMSKSLGNVYTIQDLVKMGYDQLAFRYLTLTSHYRNGLVFSLDSLKSSQVALNKLRNLKPTPNLSLDKEGNYSVNLEYKKEFIELISNDLAMSEALALVWKVAKSDLSPEEKWGTILDFDKVLGLDLDKGMIEEKIPEEILNLAGERQKARENKNWAESDRLREIIKNKGYLVEDLGNTCKIRPIT
ncbi:MAG: cysteine--tRNA ligase [Candidatus Shapirobacteria bacterium]|nr:cysteine--tRNA ligase [Candidatus Shapirobacteria bacterium]MDD3002262.1 cysteine--tRNA ligase [Candidatus Shapirobacteria bacterium]MDD4382733.1 cysteine--tRNA ligase [Candidatus Shapirobacteria bacterium]